uniref:signal peptidase II n=1 Tax=Gemmiger qucibialis TaxID=2997294 RepID=UPI003FED3F60
VLAAVVGGMRVWGLMRRLERAAWILVVGGGVGNLIDRIRTGVVVDYLNCLFINFPVFNFADVCICVGVGLLVLSLLLDMRREQKAKQQKGSAPTDGTA